MTTIRDLCRRVSAAFHGPVEPRDEAMRRLAQEIAATLPDDPDIRREAVVELAIALCRDPVGGRAADELRRNLGRLFRDHGGPTSGSLDDVPIM